MTTSLLESPVSPIIKVISDGMTNISKSIDAMAAAYVEALKTEPNLCARIRESNPEIPAPFLRALQRIGSGQLNSRLYLLGAHRSKIARLSPIEQTRAMDKPLELLTSNGEVLRVAVVNMDASQARQVFAPDHIRSPEEQRAWLESQRSKVALRAAAATPARYEVNKKKKRVVVTGACELSLIQLLDFVRELSD